MALIIKGSMGTINFHEVKAVQGYNVPRLTSKELAIPGLFGNSTLWDRWITPIAPLVTMTFTTKDGTAKSTEASLLSYCNTVQSFTVDNAAASSDVYYCIPITCEVLHVTGICSEDDTMNCMTFARWTVKLYGNAS